MSTWFQRHVLSRLWRTFVVLGVGLFVFGACTVNLGLLFMANLKLLAEHGARAAMDGAALQLVELVATGYVAVGAYVVFKTCEHRLADWLGGACAETIESGPRPPGNAPHTPRTETGALPIDEVHSDHSPPDSPADRRRPRSGPSGGRRPPPDPGA